MVSDKMDTIAEQSIQAPLTFFRTNPDRFTRGSHYDTPPSVLRAMFQQSVAEPLAFVLDLDL